ncbi:alpha/beta hydrolase [Streptosporangium lutulentum]|uniref:Pimeloyl-ACP methyl ester carboxylesterase n=1 Tax=Streptosporangium lutulentum TaxID=1461250 RepID=A0ABT9Q3N5_9ACTN|nr:alpha/beta hydrolase [Streptosporangium lutulentum]MDP9840948.1 pimeloyl-ACP methyl ester carboxylesterase [Streptosporangium lutulentum]
MPRTLRAATVAAVLSTALVACSGNTGRNSAADVAGGAPAADPSAAGSPGAITWATCTDIRRPDGTIAKPDPLLQCGKISVPLDYAKPDGPSLSIAVIRTKASGPGPRIGSLVFNFGGPGASGVDTLAQAAKAFSSLGTRYDLVSFDPRGVERSSGVRCGDDEEMDKYTSLNTLPTNEAERDAIEKGTKEFVDACGQTSGKLLPYVGTVNAAQDLDRLRAALGDKQLNYFGISYGTQLGAIYATKFPKNVNRMVLDGTLDPSATLEQRTLAQTTGFQHAYEAFLKDCVKEPGQCEIGSDTTIADKNVEKLLYDLKAKPIKVGDRTVTQGLASTAISAALYSQLTWPLLDRAVSQGLKGDGRILLALADNYNGRLPDGGYTTLMSSFPAISCVDTAERPTSEELRRTETESLKLSPLFGSPGLGSICTLWPVPGSDEARKVNAAGSAPIVVIGNTGDPATPYEWAPKLAKELGTGVLVTYKGEGHASYLSGDPCVKRTTDGYLLNGKVPAEGTVCPSS